MGTTNFAVDAVHDAIHSNMKYCKFLAVNDTKRPSSHQCGIYIPNKVAEKMIFGFTLERGENVKRPIRIYWKNSDFTTDSTCTYYGASKNECRITGFGRSAFPHLVDEEIGSLFVLVKLDEHEFDAWLLNTEEEIEYFLDAFTMTSTDTNRIIDNDLDDTSIIRQSVQALIADLSDFPNSRVMAEYAQNLVDSLFNIPYSSKYSDKKILELINMEYQMFRAIEDKLYGPVVYQGFPTMEDFVETANSILNRRKSRAGKSLEHHLSYIFTKQCIQFEEQVVTEGNKKPDFIFPSGKAYHDLEFPSDRLVFLGAKTTCKDRWRQVITEANRIPIKYLFTLQQGISSQQLAEMKDENVTVVVPRDYLRMFPQEYRSDIFTLGKFIEYVKEKQK